MPQSCIRDSPLRLSSRIVIRQTPAQRPSVIHRAVSLTMDCPKWPGPSDTSRRQGRPVTPSMLLPRCLPPLHVRTRAHLSSGNVESSSASTFLPRHMQSRQGRPCPFFFTSNLNPNPTGDNRHDVALRFHVLMSASLSRSFDLFAVGSPRLLFPSDLCVGRATDCMRPVI